ncbi:outer membrane protein assembly factor BamB [Stenotrophobium rhamnosiphilum]|uniref:Outer membrane protein assembly factor BamB n=1 Tax=Stenotrophobium rhamnosiphilum TaxID=2029166 RepID=A0A2T5MID4_9GAMM|nr:outer membrane protein assembly factor BamB [Stenotrophobium rhamnosiphilum]PTU32341.1 outer membrane protein assembly factor BamB [Stenotrophobium rhamnosiphilum]
MKLSRVAPIAVVALAALTLTACSDKNLRKPKELQSIASPTVKTDKAWTSSVGGGSNNMYSGLQLKLEDDALFAADADGEVFAFNPANGNRIWRVKTKSRVISGPGVSGNAVLVGTLDGEVIALKRADGAELWRVKASSEVLAAPSGDGDMLVTRTVDGRLSGLSVDNGERKWVSDHSVPNLTLRGLSAPLVLDGRVYIGLDNGRLAALRLTDGQPVWEQAIAVPTGRTELERLTDIDAGLLASGSEIFAVSFSGEFVCVDADTGQVLWRRTVKSYSGMVVTGDLVVVTDESGVVWGLDARTGAAAWKQEGLLYRKLSPPAAFAGYVVVGDYEGYLHWLNPKDGTIVGRSRAGSDPIRAAMVATDKLLYVMNNGGKITAVSAK